MRIRQLIIAVLLVIGLSISAAAQKKVTKDKPAPAAKKTTAVPKPKATKGKTKTPSNAVPAKSTVAARAANGRIARSQDARKEFMRQTGYPKGRKGYIIDHVVPLECGGADAPTNMQWQTIQEAKIKDRTERNCRR
jgi:hypothetical protein